MISVQGRSSERPMSGLRSGRGKEGRTWEAFEGALHDAHRGGGAIKMVVCLEETEKDDPQCDLAQEGARGFQRSSLWIVGLGWACCAQGDGAMTAKAGVPSPHHPPPPSNG